MLSLVKIKNNLSKNTLLLIGVFLLCSYFSYYTIYGNGGIFHYFKAKEDIIERKNIKKKLESELSKQKRKIKSIKTDNLDLDLLDEQTRKKLGYAKSDEYILYEE
jgi:cell division protein FtsB|tara:strand:+ start:3631 stop:3945 length:315 start_codon:yes stop_codon:yes gene_type:complete